MMLKSRFLGAVGIVAVVAGITGVRDNGTPLESHIRVWFAQIQRFCILTKEARVDAELRQRTPGKRA
jgi:hypothetical protein